MKNSLLLILFFTVYACTSRHSNFTHIDHSVYLHNKIPYMNSGTEMFSELTLTPLKEAEYFLINKVDKIRKLDSSFYLLDKKMKTIYKYDNEGNPQKRFFRVGGGSDEYIEIIDLDINTKDKELVLFCVPPKILHVDMDFNIKKSISMGFNFFDRIAVWNDKTFLYNHRARTVKSIDKNEKFRECLRTTEMHGDLIDNSPAFFKTQNALYFQSPGDDCIYKLDGDDFVPFLSLDFDNKKMSMEMYNQKNAKEISVEDIFAHPIPYIKSIFEMGDKFGFVYVYSIFERVCLYDLSQNTYVDQFLLFFSLNPSYFYGNAIYGVTEFRNIDIFQTPAFADFMKGAKFDFERKLDFDDKFENPVIIKCALN